MTDTTAEILASVDQKPASYLAAARRLKQLAEPTGLEPVRAYVLSSFTFEVVVPYLVVEGARVGLAVTAEVGPYGQLEQQVLDGDSALHAASPEVVIVAARVEDIAPELGDGFVALTASELDASIDRHVARLVAIAQGLRERSAAQIVLWNQPPLARIAAGIADPGLERSQQHALAELNHRLARGAAAVSGLVVFDAARLASELGTRQWFDPKLHVLARVPIGAAAQVAIGKRLARTLRAMRRPPCKCLVLDLDNTLWGGVLGEEGLAGIALGEDHPGISFKRFQRVVRGYRDRGILLAIASKNNASDVAEVFERHADMVLRREDFAATQVHWNDKAYSLREIAKELNVGLDALAFFDDSPVERAWVREQLPEVTVIDVPADPTRYVDALDDSGAFDQLVITAEDRVRTALYQSEQRRRELEQSASSIDEFLRALRMQVVIGRIDRETLPRAAQLLSKTNQFNVTTRRHGEAELVALLDRAGSIGLWMRVKDRFGDNGLVGLGIAVREGDAYRLDSFLMSCRVLGRKVEHALLRAIVARAVRAGASSLLGEFIPTKKNAPAAGFFADAGFSAIAGRPNWWHLDLGALVYETPLYEVIEES